MDFVHFAIQKNHTHKQTNKQERRYITLIPQITPKNPGKELLGFF
jgi:hypothetical protein